MNGQQTFHPIAAGRSARAPLRDVQADGAHPSIPLPRPVAVALLRPVRAASARRGTAHASHLDGHRPRRGTLDRLAPKRRVIALGGHACKVAHGRGRRALLRCRRLRRPRPTTKRGGHQPGRAPRYPKGAAHGRLHHHPLGHDQRTARVNDEKAEARARVGHVFAPRQARIGLFICSSGLERGAAAITMANIADNLGRWRWWEARPAPA